MKRDFSAMDLPWGMFGENFMTTGLRETAIKIGDKFGIGTAEVMVTEPRMPCYKLALKFDRTDIIKRFCKASALDFISQF